MKSRPRSAGTYEDSGSALIEIAFVLPILLVLSMGMLDFGRAFHTKSLLDQAAREGCRVAVVTAPDVGIVQDRVAQVLAAAGATGTTTVDGPGPDRMVTVTVTTTFTFVTPGAFGLVGKDFGNTITMSSQATMRFEGGST